MPLMLRMLSSDPLGLTGEFPNPSFHHHLIAGNHYLYAVSRVDLVVAVVGIRCVQD